MFGIPDLWFGIIIGAIVAYFFGPRIVAGIYGLLPISKGE